MERRCKRDCPRRSGTCHPGCPAYAADREEDAARREQKAAENAVEDYFAGKRRRRKRIYLKEFQK